MDGIAFVRAVEESLFSASRLTPTEIRALVRERVSPDCVCCGITWDAKEEVKGPDQLFERALGLQHAFPQCHLKFRSAFGRLVGRGQNQGYTICLAWSWFGQHTDEGQHLEGMRGTERRVRLEGTSIFRLRLKDIRIVEYSRYWPTASFLEQLGLSVEYPAAGFPDYVASKIDAVGGRARAAVNVVSSTMGLGDVVDPAQSPAGLLEAEETAPARERRAAERRALSIVRQQEGPAFAANMAAGSPPAAGIGSPAVTPGGAAGAATARRKRWLLSGLSSKLRPGLARQRSRSFALFRQINAQRDVQEEERLRALPLLSAERRQHLAGLE